MLTHCVRLELKDWRYKCTAMTIPNTYKRTQILIDMHFGAQRHMRIVQIVHNNSRIRALCCRCAGRRRRHRVCSAISELVTLFF